MEEKLLSVIEAAKKLEVSRECIYIWIREGRLPFVTITVLRGKPGTQPREVWRIPESKCVIPKARKPGPKKDPNAPKRKKYVSPNPRPVKQKFNRKRPVELK